MSIIEENDIKIMKFLGIPLQDGYFENTYEIMGKFPYLEYSRSPEELRFSCSFDWLIHVGQKILSNEFRKECVEKGFDPWMECYIMDDICNHKWDKKELYEAIVEFIDWYNEQTKS